MAEKEITIEIKNPGIFILIIILSAILILELQVTFNNPIVFGDEGFHAKLSQLIARNIEYPVYDPVHQTKLTKNGLSGPPLLHLSIAGFLFVFGNNEAIIRFLIPFMVFLTGISVFILGKKLFNKEVGFIASIITVTTPCFVTYSVLIYKDILVTLYLVMFFILFLIGKEKKNKIYFIASGVFGVFAYLTKINGLAAPVFIFSVFLYELLKTRKFSGNLKNYFTAFLFLVLLIGPYYLRNMYYYKTPVCDVPYVTRFFDISGCRIDEFEPKYQFEGKTIEAGTEQTVYKMGIMNYLNFVYGNIWFVVFGVFAGLFIFFSEKKENNILVLLMLLIYLPVFNYSIGRAEDAARFAVAWVPMIALVAAKYFDGIFKFIKKYQKHLALIVFIIVIFFSYQNLKEKLDVMAQVKQFSPSFFEACNWVKENLPEDVLLTTVWGHRAAFNCQRDVVGHNPDVFLSRDINYTKEVAEKLGVTHIFVQKFSLSDQILSERYNINSVQFFEDNPEIFKKVFENGPPLQQCLQQGVCDGNIIYEIVY